MTTPKRGPAHPWIRNVRCRWWPTVAYARMRSGGARRRARERRRYNRTRRRWAQLSGFAELPRLSLGGGGQTKA